MDLALHGRTALITGASKGIGAAIATTLAAEGCDLHLVARDRASLEKVAASLPTRTTVHALDLRDPAARAALAEHEVDVLVNNAGDIPAGRLDQIDDETWRHAWDLKVHGYIDLTRHFYTRMKARGSGVIVNVIGAAGERPTADYICGATANAALMAFTKALGGQSLYDGVRVVGVNPGPVQTERIDKLIATSERFRAAAAAFPLGRPATPGEIADLVAYLASDRSAYTTGTIVTVDGGASTA
ncbi:short-chain dehydrogenase/reductase [Nonomuraea sediminis]|uniref:short-chain dehydrogenase/reductase n=1 Tax=Nonomuraea sediminis TaxID=2835864 RepID=UPI001BDDBFB6|nr:short-chain dehydrogenase/reductase [Nonomuraea sediminis]